MQQVHLAPKQYKAAVSVIRINFEDRSCEVLTNRSVGALAQLSCVFPNAPDLVHRVDPVDVPVSFAITGDLADTSSAAHLRAIPNVRGVVTPERWTAWWTDRGRVNNTRASADQRAERFEHG